MTGLRGQVTCHAHHVKCEINMKIWGNRFSFPFHCFWELNSGHHACEESAFTNKLSCQPCTNWLTKWDQ